VQTWLRACTDPQSDTNIISSLPSFNSSASRRTGADQKPDTNKSEETRPSHEQGVENSHLNLDAKDQKSIANKLDQASKQEKRQEKAEEEAKNKLPTQAARDVSSHKDEYI
jgi:hypothetical protein